MTRIQPYVGLLMCALICTSCKPSLKSVGYTVPSTNGLTYSCEIFQPNQSTLLSRQTPPSRTASHPLFDLRDYWFCASHVNEWTPVVWPLALLLSCTVSVNR